MKFEYKILPLQNNIYEVIQVITIYGERTSAYDSEPDKEYKTKVYQGNLSECNFYIDCKKNNKLKQ
jgi:hypothetical protein